MARIARWMAVIVVLGVALVVGWQFKGRQHQQANPVLVLVDPEMEEGSGMGLAHRLSLGNLLQDYVEGATRSPLFRMPFAPGTESLPQEGGGLALVVRLRALRRGDHLQWVLRWARVQELRSGGTYRELQSPPLPPKQAFAWVLANLPVWVDGAALDSLLPEDPAGFWAFVEASALGNTGQNQEESIRRLEALCGRFPGSALFRVQLGIQLYFRMAGNASNSTEDQAKAQAQLEESLRLRPYLGRAVLYLTRLRTDTGSVRDALQMLQEARKQRPNDLTVLSALGYPTRYAGLLDVSAAAADQVRGMNPILGRPLRLSFHLLYLGQWDEFQASLWEWPGDVRNATCRFHRAELALIRGDREGALVLFREIEQMEESYGHFRALSRVLRLILEGHPEEAKTALQSIQKQRAGMRVADGEVTLNIAEAYALLGNAPQAIELMRGAFSQGFGCTRWYETNPTLAPARTLPEWSWLQQHLKERQKLYETRFSKASFGL